MSHPPGDDFVPRRVYCIDRLLMENKDVLGRTGSRHTGLVARDCRMVHFLFPADGIHSREVDRHFAQQASCLASAGHGVSVLPDEVLREGAKLRGIPQGATVVYRGWMLKSSEYSALTESIHRTGAQSVTEPKAYELTHFLPNWYPLLAEYTPETVVVSDVAEVAAAMKTLGWGEYFLKDYVKSLKVDGGSIVRTGADVEHWVEAMLRYRDELEGGICVRRVEKFLPETECRWFVRDGLPFAPQDRDTPIPVREAAARIGSRFFTVDIARTVAGEERIVEVGDGQVSDLVGWSAERFAEIWTTPDETAR